MADQAERRALMATLEEARNSRVLTYLTSDRNPSGAQIGEDAVRPIFDQLDEIGHVPRLDLFIYSRGGALEVPWRIASAMRQAADEWNILVPFRANSAATLLALGADHIVIGRHGELGPIDPILSVQRMGPNQGTPIQDTINVEDVMAFLRFAREEAGLTDQDTLAQSLGMLASRLDAVGLGSVYRTRTHIRDVARRMLTSQKTPPSERSMETIVETLAERVYAHGHAIGYGEAKDIGLNVERATEDEDAAMWALLEGYESHMKLRTPLDPVAAVKNSDSYEEGVILAAIESATATFEYAATLEVKAKRQMPPNLNVTMNLSLQMPPEVQGVAGQPDAQQQVLQMIQQAVQQLQQSLGVQVQQAVQDALANQAPLIGVEAAVRDGSWIRS